MPRNSPPARELTQLEFAQSGTSYRDRVRAAIATLRHYEPFALARNPRGYYVCNSFGKDSGVVVRLCQLAGVRHEVHHSLTTLDPPELIYFARDHYPDTVVHRPDVPLLARVAQKHDGPPSRLQRWCCAEYKENSEYGLWKVTGIRAEESPRRSATWRVCQPVRKRLADRIVNPILYWSTADVWRFHREERLPHCILYDEGFDRIGCIGCPMAGRQRRREFSRWPGYGLAWRRAIGRFWDRWHGVPLQRPRSLPDGRVTTQRWFDLAGMTCADDLWEWWLEERGTPSACDGMFSGGMQGGDATMDGKSRNTE